MRKTENYYEETMEGLFLSLSHSNISYQIIMQIGERNFTGIKPIITTICKLIQKYNHHDNVEIIIPNPTLYNVLARGTSEKEYWKRKYILTLHICYFTVQQKVDSICIWRMISL